ncbi:hypothetical protein CSPAE12_04395 [Colletotrichum incanum]|nr:hypothetical protein CSPAE12_04395 [Colletotrichum incanum]
MPLQLRVHFDNENEVLNLCLEFDGQPFYRPPTPIEYDGQFRIALDQVLALCKDRIANGAGARKVTLYWEIRSRYDIRSENAPSEQQDAEISLPDGSHEPRASGSNKDADDVNDAGDTNGADDTNDVDDTNDADKIGDPGDKDIDNKDDDDDDDVVFLGAAPLEQPTHGTEVSVDDLLESSDDAAGWRRTCHFFGHDEHHKTMDPEHCRQLPGTKRKLRPHQLDDVRRVIERAATDGRLGALLEHPMGVGKTITYQAVIARTSANCTPQPTLSSTTAGMDLTAVPCVGGPSVSNALARRTA